MQDFRNLRVWKYGHQLTLDVYKATGTLPRNEQYGLTSQLRRSAASIPANIAEGCGRYGNAELKRFLQIAMGSASELEYHILLTRDLAYIDGQTYESVNQQVISVKRMLASLITSLR